MKNEATEARAGMAERAAEAEVFNRYYDNLVFRLTDACERGLNVNVKEAALKVLEYQKIFGTEAN